MGRWIAVVRRMTNTEKGEMRIEGEQRDGERGCFYESSAVAGQRVCMGPSMSIAEGWP